MSGTIETPSVTEGGAVEPPHPPRNHPIARASSPVALVLGSVLAAGGMGLHLPAMPEDVGIPLAIAAAPERWIGAHLLLGFGFSLLAIGAGGLLSLLRRDRGSTLTAIGALTTALGAVTMALSDAAHGAVGLALTEVEPATSLEIHEVYFAHPAMAAINAGPMLLSVGMIVLGVGLFRSRAHPRWVSVLLVLTPVAVNLGFSLELPTAVHGIPLVLGMSALAYALVRRPEPNPAALRTYDRSHG
jgi:hypothetical protein